MLKEMNREEASCKIIQLTLSCSNGLIMLSINGNDYRDCVELSFSLVRKDIDVIELQTKLALNLFQLVFHCVFGNPYFVL